MNLVGFDYINEKDHHLTKVFINSTTTKKYILGINSFTKSILKYIKVDGIIDDFTRVQSSRKKDILDIQDISNQNSIILSVSTGSPLEVKKILDKMQYINFNYLSFYRYSNLKLKAPPFIVDFKDDFLNNKQEYQKIYNMLEDKKSKYFFTKILNFKQTFDLTFMQGFTNNHKEQYFDKELIPQISNIDFLDGGGYIGDTLPFIIENFPTFNNIYLVEPSSLHIKIAKRNFKNIKNIKFINQGLGKKREFNNNDIDISNNCNHNYQATSTDTIDNILGNNNIDFIKLDIEGSEVDAILGAKKSILAYHPILTICIYHKASHWYEVPNIVFSIRQDYKIYLRHYMEGIYETVLYFIPIQKD